MMSLNNSQSLASTRTSGRSRSRSRKRRAPGEDKTMAGKPSTPGTQPKQLRLENAVTIAVSSRILFNMEEEQQVEHENQPLSPGPAFCFVKVLEVVNVRLRELYPESEELFRVILLTNHQDTRLNNTIEHYKLVVEVVATTKRNSLIGLLKKHHTNLYLSEDNAKVKEALAEGIAAATMLTPQTMTEVSETQLRVAFDGDAVLFSNESECVFKGHGLKKYLKHEKEHEDEPMNDGPLRGFMEVLWKLQKKFYDKDRYKDCPIHTYLVTARGAAVAGYRALNTLRSWGLEMDEAFFLSGAPKGPMLEKIRPHIFFDDQMFHVEDALKHGTLACHVPEV